MGRKYNSRKWAEEAFDDLIKNTKSHYIIISYNNRGIIPIDKFKDILEKYGELEVLTINHKTYNRLIGQSAYKKIGEVFGSKIIRTHVSLVI